MKPAGLYCRCLPYHTHQRPTVQQQFRNNASYVIYKIGLILCRMCSPSHVSIVHREHTGVCHCCCYKWFEFLTLACRAKSPIKTEPSGKVLARLRSTASSSLLPQPELRRTSSVLSQPGLMSASWSALSRAGDYTLAASKEFRPATPQAEPLQLMSSGTPVSFQPAHEYVCSYE